MENKIILDNHNIVRFCRNRNFDKTENNVHSFYHIEFFSLRKKEDMKGKNGYDKDGVEEYLSCNCLDLLDKKDINIVKQDINITFKEGDALINIAIIDLKNIAKKYNFEKVYVLHKPSFSSISHCGVYELRIILSKLDTTEKKIIKKFCRELLVNYSKVFHIEE